MVMGANPFGRAGSKQVILNENLNCMRENIVVKFFKFIFISEKILFKPTSSNLQIHVDLDSLAT